MKDEIARNVPPCEPSIAPNGETGTGQRNAIMRAWHVLDGDSNDTRAAAYATCLATVAVADGLPRAGILEFVGDVYDRMHRRARLMALQSPQPDPQTQEGAQGQKELRKRVEGAIVAGDTNG